MFIRFDHKNIYKARLPTVQVYHWRMKNIQSYMYVQPKIKRYLQYNNQALIKTYEQQHVNGKVEYAYGSTIYIYEFQEWRMQTFKETKTKWAKTFSHKTAHMISKGNITTSYVGVILISDINKPTNRCRRRATPILGLQLYRT